MSNGSDAMHEILQKGIWGQVDVLSYLAAIAVLVMVSIANFSAVMLNARASRHGKGGEDDAINSSNDLSLTRANMLSGVICGIAALMYIFMKHPSVSLEANEIRSLDWLITCPLLLFEMAALLGASALDPWVIVSVIGAILMVAVGWNSMYLSPARLLGGFVFLTIVYIAMWKVGEKSKQNRSETKSRLVVFFLGIWVFYGLVSCMTSFGWATNLLMASSLYSILDIISKALFGLCILWLSIHK
jgi:hypothetical protein